MRLSSALAWLNTRAAAPAAGAPEPLRNLPETVICLPPPSPVQEREQEQEQDRLWDLRSVSPRRFAQIAHELYLSGMLTWDQYCMVGFPSELHPNYDTTIGALTGEKARPDKARDMLADWEERLEFQRRHKGDDRVVRRAERILGTLQRHRHGFIPLES